MMPDAEYREQFLGEEYQRPTKQFVRYEVVPRVLEAVGDYGDGYVCDKLPVHTREIEAMADYIKGSLKE